MTEFGNTVFFRSFQEFSIYFHCCKALCYRAYSIATINFFGHSVHILVNDPIWQKKSTSQYVFAGNWIWQCCDQLSVRSLLYVGYGLDGSLFGPLFHTWTSSLDIMWLVRISFWFVRHLIRFFKTEGNLPIDRAITRSSLKLEAWGPNLKLVKSDTVFPTPRHYCYISSKEAVLPGHNDPEMGPANLLLNSSG